LRSLSLFVITKLAYMALNMVLYARLSRQQLGFLLFFLRARHHRATLSRLYARLCSEGYSVFTLQVALNDVIGGDNSGSRNMSPVLRREVTQYIGLQRSAV